MLTVLSLLPDDALQVDAGARFTGTQTFGLGGQSRVRGVDGHGARADHDLLTRGGDVAVADRSEEVERWRCRRGDRRLHLREISERIQLVSDEKIITGPNQDTAR